MITACAEHVGWDAAVSETQETLGSRTGDGSKQAWWAGELG